MHLQQTTELSCRDKWLIKQVYNSHIRLPPVSVKRSHCSLWKVSAHPAQLSFTPTPKKWANHKLNKKNVNDLLNPWLLVSIFTSPEKMQNVIPVALPSSKQAHQNSNSFGETEVKLPEKISWSFLSSKLMYRMGKC